LKLYISLFINTTQPHHKLCLHRIKNKSLEKMIVADVSE